MKTSGILLPTFLCLLFVHESLGTCKTVSGLTCLTKEDPDAGLYFEFFGWKSTCFKLQGRRWCMDKPGNLKTCKCTSDCCGVNDNEEDDGSNGGSGGSGSSQGSGGGSSQGSNGGSNQGSSSGSGQGSNNGACDSSSLEDFNGCTALKETYCPLTSTSHGGTEQNTLCLYCGENQQACGGKICQYGIPSAADKKVIVDQHNQWRAKVAKGEEKRGVGGSQPSASDMFTLVWDENLAKGAQMWALQCQKGHDKNRLTPEFNGPNTWVGQNIASAWSSVKTMDRDYVTMMSGWYDEVVDFPPGNVRRYSKAGATGVIGHYTALAWASTTRVGCGFVMYYDRTQPRYPYKKVLICNYGAGGNILGTPMYQIGAAGSACPNGQTNGLCN